MPSSIIRYKTNILTTALTAMLVIGLLVLSITPAFASGVHRNRSYIALGDSVAGGLGLNSGEEASDQDRLCGRSLLAYPELVAQHLKHNAEYQNVACIGATTEHMSNPQTIHNISLAPQLDAAFAKGTPRLISISVGANDAQWASFIGACFATDCSTQQYTDLANAYLAQLSANLPAVLEEIASRSQGKVPDVILTGYYNPMSANCVALDGITMSEIAWISNETQNLNAVIEASASQFSFAKFAEVDFTGHDICSYDSWIQQPGGSAPAPFHPTQAGQQVIAQAVLEAAGKNPIIRN